MYWNIKCSYPKHVSDLILSIKDKFKLWSSVFIKTADIEFDGVDKSQFDKEISRDQMGDIWKEDQLYDLVLWSMPFWLRNSEWNDSSKNIKIKERENWITIFQSLYMLSDNWIWVYFVEPGITDTAKWRKFIEELKSKWFYLNAIISIWEIKNFCTSLIPYIVVISKSNAEKVFVAEIGSETNIETIVTNYMDTNADSLSTLEWMFIELRRFRSFTKLKISKQISILWSQYKEYKEYKLKDIASEFNTSNELAEKENSVYIPMLWTSDVVSELSSATVKHQNLFQVVLDSSIVCNGYVKLFLSSELWKLILKSLESWNFISKINKADIAELVIPLPPMNEQMDILKSSIKLNDLKCAIDWFIKELALSPKSSDLIQPKIDDMLVTLDLASESDRVLALLRGEEWQHLEFKETLSKDVNKWTSADYIKHSAMKTIAAFCNTPWWWILLIWVNDNWEVTWIENDFYKDDDKYKNWFKDIFKSSIWMEHYDDIKYRIVVIEDKKVLYVKCNKSNKPVWIWKKFYRRTDPATGSGH